MNEMIYEMNHIQNTIKTGYLTRPASDNEAILSLHKSVF